MPNSRVRQVIAYTADHTIGPGDFGGVLTNGGASTSAVVFTLPAALTTTPGAWVRVYVVDNGTVTVQTLTTDTLIVDGDATADSIAWQTSSHKIGNSAEVFNTGTAWACVLSPAATTTTIATQTIAT
jgi:hypothetical protein